YLETKEDAEHNQQVRAAHVIERFCRENGVTDARQIQKSLQVIAGIFGVNAPLPFRHQKWRPFLRYG
ncbi:MAG: hypothetical protein Q8S19_08670, partial [Bacillota bacterium]|nr:hypothetical protein [Bacillota bacterium]